MINHDYLQLIMIEIYLHYPMINQIKKTYGFMFKTYI